MRISDLNPREKLAKTHSENASAGLDGAADLSGALPDDLGEMRECRVGGVILGCRGKD